MSILVDDSNKTACRAAEAGLQQKNCAALVRPAGTGKGCIVWELLDAHPEMRVLWVVSCAARLELRRALTKRLGRTLDGRVRLMSCEQLAVQNALGWVALAEFRPGLLVLDGWREMSAKDWTDCVPVSYTHLDVYKRQVDDLSAYNVGYLIYFFWRACACSGYLLSVNPFNQPGVESYKKNMFALLGKPGYENLTAELEAKLK